MSESENRGGGEEIKRERELSELELSWGEGHPSSLPHSMRCGCENSECSRSSKFASNNEIIGVKKAPYVNDGRRMAVICECSECFTRYWFHTSDIHAKIYKEDHELAEF